MELEEGEETSEIHGDGVLYGCTGRLSQPWLLVAKGGGSKQPAGGGPGGAAPGRRWSSRQGKGGKEGSVCAFFFFFCFPKMYGKVVSLKNKNLKNPNF